MALCHGEFAAHRVKDCHEHLQMQQRVLLHAMMAYKITVDIVKIAKNTYRNSKAEVSGLPVSSERVQELHIQEDIYWFYKCDACYGPCIQGQLDSLRNMHCSVARLVACDSACELVVLMHQEPEYGN